jgi:thioredoxin reductase (NADPH)
MMNQSPRECDVIIIGGGPAGLSAGIYTARARLTSLLIEREIVGGQILNTEWVEDYPGYPDGISGIDLTEAMHRPPAAVPLPPLMLRGILPGCKN